MEHKECSKCSELKELNTENFAMYNGRYRSECKDCSRKMCRDYKARNRDKISSYNKQYKSTNQETIAAYNKQYFAENKEKIIKQRAASEQRRKETQEGYKILVSQRKRIHNLLNSKKYKHTIEYLGCNIEFLKKWMQIRMDEDMTFENHGMYWHIDHVIPCASFDLNDIEQQKICLHWSNLRPLRASENQSKGAKILEDEIKSHREFARLYIQYLRSKTGDKYTFTDVPHYDKFD